MHPFTDILADSVGHAGEKKLLRKIRQWLGPIASPQPLGMGDDCAVLPASKGGCQLATVDALVYKKHFDDSAHPGEAGAKLLKRNLSDIAAMGGQPDYALLGLMLPASLRLDWLREFTFGLRDEAVKWHVALVGGDLCETKTTLGGHLTLLGSAERAVLRQGGKEGDFILVTGELGGSRLGKHLSFQPRLREGQWLAGRKEVSSMIDVTDGLLKDLPELIPPGCAAGIDLKNLPISEAAHQMALTSGKTPQHHALGDGEDYELLFTVGSETSLNHFIGEWVKQFKTPLSKIGRLMAKAVEGPEGEIIDGQTGQAIGLAGGYEHFSKSWRENST